MKYLMMAVLMIGVPVGLLQAQTQNEAAKVAGKVDDRLESSAMVLSEIMKTPDNSIPHDLLDKAVCVGIIPGEKKLAFLVGGSYGRGVLECRKGGNGPWAAPLMIGLHSGSIGFQWGARDTDLILVVMNPGGVRDLLKSKGEIGADVSAAAGPVGRTAEANTDLMMNAEILTYSRSRGLFGGVSLKGGAIAPDTEANARLYDHFIDAQHFIFGGGDYKIPAQAKPLISELDKYSPRGGKPFERVPGTAKPAPPTH